MPLAGHPALAALATFLSTTPCHIWPPKCRALIAFTIKPGRLPYFHLGAIMSNQTPLTQFLATKFFAIPKYQRSFAWEKDNVRDLYNDVIEAIDTESSHYIGTVVLAKTDKTSIFSIVDGQQRITTIVLFLSVIISQLPNKDDRDYWRRYYIQTPERFKLTPLERDKNFYFELLTNDQKLEPKNKSQRFLLDAFDEMHNLLKVSSVDPSKLLKAFGDLSVLEFVEDNESDAIRIFQTVNDRGKELSRMDKMKSLLFYFSNKYCGSRHDDEINDKFGAIFELYDDIKLVGESEKINIISSKQFNEDDLLRHHHICFSEESFDPSGQFVLDDVRASLLKLREDKNLEAMSVFISGYLDSLLEYAHSFRDVISRVSTDALFYKMFVILGLSVAYYPVITVLEKNSLLNAMMPSKKISVLEMIEIIDVRVMKVREFAGRKHISKFAYRLNNSKMNLAEVEKTLLWINANEITDDRFKDFLKNYDYYKSTGLLRTLFIDHCEHLSGRQYSLDQLKRIMNDDPTIEHILSQTPDFKPRAFGFKNNEEFEEHMNLIGNLTLLEKKLNSGIKNGDLSQKSIGYSKSKFRMTSEIGTQLSATNNGFKKDALKKRNEELVNTFSNRWWGS